MSDPTPALIPIDPSTHTPEPPARRRGAQPGNQNAFRHGFYAANLGQRPVEELDERVLHNLNGEIAMIKDFMFWVYENNKDSDDPKVLAASLRALSLAGFSLTRLMLNSWRVKFPASSNVNMDTLLTTLNSIV